MKKKVLVCGASGFIGRNIFEELFNREDVELLGTCFGDRFSHDMRLVDIDLTSQQNALDITSDMDIVIHAAAVTSGMDAVKNNQERYVADNVRINTNLIEAAHLNKVSHFIFLSCTVMYPDSSSPLREGQIDLARVHPAYFPFADLKVFAEKLCEFYSRQGKTKYTVLRPSSIYGPYDKFHLSFSHVLDATIVRVMNSKEGGEIPVWGTGKATRDFLHIYDLVRLIEMLIKSEHITYKCEVFNVASGVSTSIRELAEKIVKVSGKNLKVVCDTSKNSIDSQTSLDITKVCNYFLWGLTIDLGEGLKQTIDWYLTNLGEQNGR